MPKKCPRCGYENPDDALYCMRCGYPLSQQSGSSTNVLENAFNLLLKNSKLIYFPLGFLILQILVLIILFLFTAIPPVSIFRPLVVGISLLVAFVLSVIESIGFAYVINRVTEEAYHIVAPQNPLKMDFSKLYNYVIGLGIIGGILGLAGQPLVWVIVGLLSLGIYIASILLMENAQVTLDNIFNWLSRLFNQDVLTAIVIIILGILNMIPVIDVFTIPYLALVFVEEEIKSSKI
ncbi:MAG: zinc ribbon domain-containing protein [Sulfolobaceae archaeon]|nr:zinc ribbon domain-containing protein [Sulfolobaceae archaeon]